MSKVDEAIVEIQEALGALELPLEGLQDFERLNLGTDALGSVRQARIQHTRRQTKLVNTMAALNSLVDDGYPELRIPDVSLSVHQDLKAQQESIEAALSKFKTDAASSLDLSGQLAQEK